MRIFQKLHRKWLQTFLPARTSRKLIRKVHFQITFLQHETPSLTSFNPEAGETFFLLRLQLQFFPSPPTTVKI